MRLIQTRRSYFRRRFAAPANTRKLAMQQLMDPHHIARIMQHNGKPAIRKKKSPRPHLGTEFYGRIPLTLVLNKFKI